MSNINKCIALQKSIAEKEKQQSLLLLKLKQSLAIESLFPGIFKKGIISTQWKRDTINYTNERYINSLENHTLTFKVNGKPIKVFNYVELPKCLQDTLKNVKRVN